jgi:hypothetical protein
MEEATCERRNARGGMADRNKKAGREKEVGLETSTPDEKLSQPFSPAFFSKVLERFYVEVFAKPLHKTSPNTSCAITLERFQLAKKKLSSPPGAHVRCTSHGCYLDYLSMLQTKNKKKN